MGGGGGGMDRERMCGQNKSILQNVFAKVLSRMLSVKEL